MEIGLLYFSIQPKHVAEATPEIPRAIKPTDANLISFMMLLQKNAALKATPLASNVKLRGAPLLARPSRMQG